MRVFTQVKRLCGILVLGGMFFASSPVMAQQQATNIIIGNDRGGLVGQRADLINRIRALGQRVEIRGPMCLSSCTMFLGAGNVCVSPRATFGFHGPSSYGQPLTRADFDHWSTVIANHYPAPLRSWFMSTARYKISGYHSISGSELIRMGVARC